MTIRNNRGFTLTEVLIASMLLSLTAAAAFFLAVSFYRNYFEITENIETEISLANVSFALQRSLSLAVNIESVATIPNGVSLVAGQGQIRSFDGTTMGATPGEIVTIATFLRENGGHQAVPVSEFLPTGIFYARPTPTTSGVLFIDSSSTGVLSPKYSGLYYDKIVEFSVGNFETSLGTPPDLTSVELTVVVRKFLSENSSDWIFCPQTDITNGVAGCSITDKAPFKDVKLITRVTFSNQIVNDQDPRSTAANAPYERTFGNLYLFPQR